MFLNMPFDICFIKKEFGQNTQKHEETEDEHQNISYFIANFTIFSKYSELKYKFPMMLMFPSMVLLKVSIS